MFVLFFFIFFKTKAYHSFMTNSSATFGGVEIGRTDENCSPPSCLQSITPWPRLTQVSGRDQLGQTGTMHTSFTKTSSPRLTPIWFMVLGCIARTSSLQLWGMASVIPENRWQWWAFYQIFYHSCARRGILFSRVSECAFAWAWAWKFTYCIDTS